MYFSYSCRVPYHPKCKKWWSPGNNIKVYSLPLMTASNSPNSRTTDSTSFWRAVLPIIFWYQYLRFLWETVPLPVVLTTCGLSGTVNPGTFLPQPRAGHLSQAGPIRLWGFLILGLYLLLQTCSLNPGCCPASCVSWGPAPLLYFDSNPPQVLLQNYHLLKLARLGFDYFQQKNPTW